MHKFKELSWITIPPELPERNMRAQSTSLTQSDSCVLHTLAAHNGESCRREKMSLSALLDNIIVRDHPVQLMNYKGSFESGKSVVAVFNNPAAVTNSTFNSLNQSILTPTPPENSILPMPYKSNMQRNYFTSVQFYKSPAPLTLNWQGH